MLSVIIPTRNRADLLAACLASLINQELGKENFEILVIDNGSNDRTQDVIKYYQSKLPNLTAIFAPEPGLHIGRHTGMNAANGNLLVFADDDIEALPSWLKTIYDAFKDPDVAMVGGNNYPKFIEPPPVWLKLLWNQHTIKKYKSIPSLSVIEFTGSVKKISPYLIWGCNFAIRKDILLRAGGFHPDSMPKELIKFRGDGETHVSRFVEKSGMKCVFHPGASIYHKVTPERMTYSYFWQRGYNQGISASYTNLREQNMNSRSIVNLNLLKRLFHYSVHKTIELINSAEVKKAFEVHRNGFKEGYAFHQQAYLNDPKVRNWVHRPKYF